MNFFRTGFVGASTTDATNWVKSKVEGAEQICVPFTGSGKDVQAMAHEKSVIESWDTQAYSRLVVEGIFAAEKAVTNVDQIRYRKGYMYETRALKNIDERCAGFIDWVAKNGTDFDKACIASAIIRSTFMGRVTQWYTNIEGLWKRFDKIRKYNEGWVNQPGKFIAHEASFFDQIPTRSYDLMQVDPPKVVVGSDIYSANFDGLNKALGGVVPHLPKWDWRNSLGSFQQLLEVDTKRIIFLYVSGVRPSLEEVLDLLVKDGTIEEMQEFPHRGRTDYGIVVKRS